MHRSVADVGPQQLLGSSENETELARGTGLAEQREVGAEVEK